MLKEAIGKLLQSLAVNMDEDQKAEFARHVEEKLEQRVGEAIAELLDDDELEQYLQLTETGSDEEIKKWLEANLPEYKDVISDEADILIGEIAENSEHL